MNNLFIFMISSIVILLTEIIFYVITKQYSHYLLGLHCIFSILKKRKASKKAGAVTGTASNDGCFSPGFVVHYKTPLKI